MQTLFVINLLLLEVSSAGCFSWLCTLCLRRFFLKLCCDTEVSVYLTSSYGHASSMHTVLCLPLPPLCSDTAAICSLLHGLQQVVRHGFNKVFFSSE